MEHGGDLEAEVQRLRMGLDASLGDVKHRLEVRVCVCVCVGVGVCVRACV